MKAKPMSAVLFRHAVVPLALAAVLALAPALAACGKRGVPEPPPDGNNTYPRSYPAPSSYAPPAQAPPAHAPPADAPPTSAPPTSAPQ